MNKSEIEILREFQNDGVVIKTVHLYSNSSGKNHEWLKHKIIFLTQSAMREAGIEFNDRVKFADVLFFNLIIPDNHKINILRHCKGQEERINALRRK
jgi:hypothetical protein